jgi:hypothetical protein
MPAKPPSPYESLVEAAAAFAEELQSYSQLSEAFVRAPLVSAKHLERINETLTKIADCEQRLSACGQQLAQAVSVAREEQERLARATLDRIPAVRERTNQLGGLLARFEALGKEAAVLNESTTGAEADNAKARALLEQVQGMTDRARQLTDEARETEFEELARRAHALYQQLFSAQKKLELATVS